MSKKHSFKVGDKVTPQEFKGPRKLSGAAKIAHEKKLAQAIPPCFPDAPRPEAKAGEKFVMLKLIKEA